MQVKNDLRFAQNKALTGDKVTNSPSPAGCQTTTATVTAADVLVGWYVKFDRTSGNNTSYQIVGDCFSGGYEKKFGAITYRLPSDVVISTITVGGVGVDVANVLFRPLDLGVSFHDFNGISAYFF